MYMYHCYTLIIILKLHYFQYNLLAYDFFPTAVMFLLVGLVSGIVLTLFILSVIFIFVIAYRKYKSKLMTIVMMMMILI